MWTACSRSFGHSSRARRHEGRFASSRARPRALSTAPVGTRRLRGALNGVARAAVIATLLPAVLLALGYQWELAGSWWLELLQYMPWPLYLLPALAAFIASFLLRPVWRLAAALGLGLVLTVVMGLAVNRGDAGASPMRFMTYNIKAYLAKHRPGGFDVLAQEVARHDPDILVMQDAGDFARLRQQQPELAASVFAGRSVHVQGQYIVVSRYPLRDCRPGDLSLPGGGYDYVRCTVTVHGVDVDVVTAHLVSPRHGLAATRRDPAEGIDDWEQNFNDRLAQSQHLAADLRQRRSFAPPTRALIVAGDLNAPETSPVIRSLLNLGLRDAFSAGGRGYGYTYGHALEARSAFFGSFLRIDHILVSPGIGVAGCFAGGAQASEHRPVIADLLLQREPR